MGRFEMKKELFDMLIESVREAGAIMRGEKKASRAFDASVTPHLGTTASEKTVREFTSTRKPKMRS